MTWKPIALGGGRPWAPPSDHLGADLAVGLLAPPTVESWRSASSVQPVDWWWSTSRQWRGPGERHGWPEVSLTPWRSTFRRLAGDQGYAGGLDRYIEGVIYPERYTWCCGGSSASQSWSAMWA